MFERVGHIYYINLDDRHDRDNHMRKQFDTFQIPYEKITRYSAMKHDKGYIGCGYSHINVLQDALMKGYENILVLEDDFEFVRNKIYVDDIINRFLLEYKNGFNICLLSYNLFKSMKYNDYLVEVINGQTTSGYIIHKSYIPTLLTNFREGILGLENGKTQRTHSIDVIWKKLQGQGNNFFAFEQRLGIQMKSYSDIEKKIANYKC